MDENEFAEKHLAMRKNSLSILKYLNMNSTNSCYFMLNFNDKGEKLLVYQESLLDDLRMNAL